MTSKRRLALVACLVGLMVLGVVGCAARFSRKLAATVPRERPARDQAAVRRFDENRDRNELYAAGACWRRGDAAGCQARLDHLLARSPEHAEGRLLMAEMLAATRRPQEAVAHLQRLVAMHPDNARAQHALNRLLEDRSQVDRTAGREPPSPDRTGSPRLR
jgi:predicted Zn-dependent protease